MQNRSELSSLIQAALQERNRIQNSQKKTPLLIKIAPDLNDQDLEEIADVILNNPEVDYFLLILNIFYSGF